MLWRTSALIDGRRDGLDIAGSAAAYVASIVIASRATKNVFLKMSEKTSKRLDGLAATPHSYSLPSKKPKTTTADKGIARRAKDRFDDGLV